MEVKSYNFLTYVHAASFDFSNLKLLSSLHSIPGLGDIFLVNVINSFAMPRQLSEFYRCRFSNFLFFFSSLVSYLGSFFPSLCPPFPFPLLLPFSRVWIFHCCDKILNTHNLISENAIYNQRVQRQKHRARRAWWTKAATCGLAKKQREQKRARGEETKDQLQSFRSHLHDYTDTLRSVLY